MNGLLCLKWNNHSSSLLKKLSVIHAKEIYCDATIACQGKYYPVHRLVLSTCSEYFEEIFDRTQCRHPFIIVKDIEPVELEALLSYMYNGEVNVLQDTLSGLIKAAETLRIKGLAVPDEVSSDSSKESKKRSNTSIPSSLSKRACRRSGETQENSANASSSDTEDMNVEPLNCIQSIESLSEANLNCETEPESHEESDQQMCDIKVEVFDFAESAEENRDYDPSPSKDPFSNLVLDTSYPSDIKNAPDPSSSPVPSPPKESQPMIKTEIDVAQCSTWDSDLNSGSNPVPEEMCCAKDLLLGPTVFESLNLAVTAPDDILKVAFESPLNLSPPPAPKQNTSSDLPNSEFECSYCPFKSTSRNTWQQHNFATHPGNHLYACKVCKYRTSQKSLLNRHMFVHNGEKRFKCNFCSYKTAYSYNMKSHSLKHLPKDK